MAITSKPKRNQTDIVPPSDDDPALKFIAGAGQAEPEPAKVEPTAPRKAKPILIRGIDCELLERLDEEAARRRVSRAAMVRMILAERLLG